MQHFTCPLTPKTEDYFHASDSQKFHASICLKMHASLLPQMRGTQTGVILGASSSCFGRLQWFGSYVLYVCDVVGCVVGYTQFMSRRIFNSEPLETHPYLRLSNRFHNLGQTLVTGLSCGGCLRSVCRHEDYSIHTTIISQHNLIVNTKLKENRS